MTEAASQAPTAEEMQAWRGHRLDEIGGGGVGRIEGVFVDAESGKPEWLLARMGRFGHHTLIPGRDAVEGVGHIWVPYGRDQIRAAPRIDATQPIPAHIERSLLEHYGVGGPAGRAAEIAGREADAITLRPAS